MDFRDIGSKFSEWIVPGKLKREVRKPKNTLEEIQDGLRYLGHNEIVEGTSATDTLKHYKNFVASALPGKESDNEVLSDDEVLDLEHFASQEPKIE